MAGKPGRSGRKRKSDVLKIANGTYRADRDGDPDLKPTPIGEPKRPRFRLKAASQFWDQHVPELVRMGVASSIDAPRLQTMCEAWALLRAATSAVNKDPISQPARAAYAEYSRQFSTAASEFGLNPSSRSRIQVVIKKQVTGIKGRTRG